MTNADVARVFDELADLLEIQGADTFRVNSYRRVARTIGDLSLDLQDVAARGELDQLPGVGKSSAQKIRELLETGHLAARDELLKTVPATLLDLLTIPGLGPKKVALLWKEALVQSLDDLKAALADGRLLTLRGFGEKSLAQIVRGIAFRAQSAGRTRLGTAWEIATHLRQAIAGLSGVQRVEWAGSLRRARETVGDLDLLCIADDGAAVIREFTHLECVAEVLVAGATKGSVRYEYRPGRALQIDLRVVPAASFGAAWQYFTGSKEHNIRLRERAVKRGWSLNEYGLTEGERVIAAATEEDIYAALDVPWIPPELREDQGELDLADPAGGLLRDEDIRADLHMHTPASDGHDSVAALAEAAQERGYKLICITEHSRSSAIANGLTIERLREHVEYVRAAAKSLSGIAVWIGAEVDILADGTLDYPDEVLAELDFVIASVHSGLGQDIAANTRRTLAAIRNPCVNCIAHPTGRLINEREAMALDVEAVARAAAETGTALEINANDYRLDLKDSHARLARDLGVTISINTDAHAVDQLDQMRFGVLTARRAGLAATNVLNCRAPKEIKAFVAAKRQGKKC